MANDLIVFELDYDEEGNRGFSITQGDKNIIIDYKTFDAMRRAWDREYYEEDLEDYLECIDRYKLDGLYDDEDLIEKILDYYAQLRYENDGGGDEYVLNYQECLEETLLVFEDELKYYLWED